jgi:hypothetical protein
MPNSVLSQQYSGKMHWLIMIMFHAATDSDLVALKGRSNEMNVFKPLAVTSAILICLSTQSKAEPLKTMDDVGRAIDTCWQAPSDAKGSVTLSFSFKRDGTLIGKPRPTSIAVDGDDKVRQQFIASAIDALSSCTPLTFSSGLAAGIAGQVFTMPFTAPKDSSGPMVTTQ